MPVDENGDEGKDEFKVPFFGPNDKFQMPLESDNMFASRSQVVV